MYPLFGRPIPEVMHSIWASSMQAISNAKKHACVTPRLTARLYTRDVGDWILVAVACFPSERLLCVGRMGDNKA